VENLFFGRQRRGAGRQKLILLILQDFLAILAQKKICELSASIDRFAVGHRPRISNLLPPIKYRQNRQNQYTHLDPRSRDWRIGFAD
jgi:hypothetical protein